MRRLFFLFLISFALRASTFTYSSCTAGTTTDTPCPGNALLTQGLSGPGYLVSAFAQASDIPGSISARAGTTAEYSRCLPSYGCPPFPPFLSASAQVMIDDTYYTSGSPRPGFIQLTVSLGGATFSLWTIASMMDHMNTLAVLLSRPVRKDAAVRRGFLLNWVSRLRSP